MSHPGPILLRICPRYSENSLLRRFNISSREDFVEDEFRFWHLADIDAHAEHVRSEA
jgi:hypothetical protein